LKKAQRKLRPREGPGILWIAATTTAVAERVGDRTDRWFTTERVLGIAPVAGGVFRTASRAERIEWTAGVRTERVAGLARECARGIDPDNRIVFHIGVAILGLRVLRAGCADAVI